MGRRKDWYPDAERIRDEKAGEILAEIRRHRRRARPSVRCMLDFFLEHLLDPDVTMEAAKELCRHGSGRIEKEFRQDLGKAPHEYYQAHTPGSPPISAAHFFC